MSRASSTLASTASAIFDTIQERINEIAATADRDWETANEALEAYDGDSVAEIMKLSRSAGAAFGRHVAILEFSTELFELQAAIEGNLNTRTP